MVGTPAKRIGIAACALLLSFFAAAPAPARADTGTGATQTHYSTTITTVYGSQYPIAGHLDLELFADGTLRGYYHNAFQKAFIQVVGGRDGSYIWFDIGPSPVDLGIGIGTGERLHIVATMNGDGSFRGQAFPQMTLANSNGAIDPVNQATANDQYLFAATPVEKGPEDYQPPNGP